jgi:hypothetical protein
MTMSPGISWTRRSNVSVNCSEWGGERGEDTPQPAGARGSSLNDDNVASNRRGQGRGVLHAWLWERSPDHEKLATVLDHAAARSIPPQNSLHINNILNMVARQAAHQKHLNMGPIQGPTCLVCQVLSAPHATHKQLTKYI